MEAPSYEQSKVEQQNASVEPMALVPFSYANPFHDAMRDKERVFPMLGRDVRIEQRWKPDGKGGTGIGFGAAVYDAAIALSLFLESNPDMVKGKKVLELGSGPGLVSVVASALDAQQVIATDGDNDSVNLTKHNLEKNKMASNSHAEQFLWGNTPSQAMQAHIPFDLIVGSDIVACPYADALEALVKSMNEISNEDTRILLAYKKRKATETAFFELFEQTFDVTSYSEEYLHPDFRSSGIQLFLAKRKQTEKE